MRSVELCPHRDPQGAAGEPSCRLVVSVLEVEPPGAAAVGLDACRACCVGPVPDRRRLGPVVASLVARSAEEILGVGGVPGCDPDRAAELRAWAHDRLLVSSAAIGRGNPSRSSLMGRADASVAIIIPCHEHGEFLGAAIESVLAQTVPPDEIVVVDDASSDDTAAVARRHAASGVAYQRVDVRSAYRARAAGFAATRSEIVCFLDADDLLPADFIERGLPLFDRAEVGIVYPDLDYFGEQQGRRSFPEFRSGVLECYNFMPSSSLVRRRAIEIADSFREPDRPEILEDWLVWRRIAEAGWSGVKHPGAVRYRRHPADYPSRSTLNRGRSYFEAAGLSLAEVTIVTPLAGRSGLWPSYRDWLAKQTWPRAQCQVFLVDSSGDAHFGRAVREFLAACDYPATRYLALDVAEPGLADRPRDEVLEAVNLACARIYNRIAREVTTPFVLIVEDDILPPVGVIARLLQAMDERTAAVAAPYRSRHHSCYVAYDHRLQHYPSGTGVHAVGGAGFGCLLVRRAALAGETFLFGYAESVWFDHAFCRRLRQAGWTIKVDWSQECLHRDEP